MKIKQPSLPCSPLFIFPFFFLLFSLFSCGNPLIQKIVEPKKISFESNGGSRVESQTVLKMQLVKRPADPSKDGCTFDAWYTDNDTFLEEWDFDVSPTGAMTLYAKWDTDEMIPITDVAITVTQPETGAVPDTAAIGTGNFTVGAVSWDPDDNPFHDSVEYTATVTLTAHQGYAFAPELTATINGNDATVINNESTLVLSYAFPPTKIVTGIAVTTPPTKLAYIHGEALDLEGLVVTLTYDGGSTEEVAFNHFPSRNISTSPAHGVVLSHTAYNNQPVEVYYGGLSLAAQTGNLTVNLRALTITGATHTKPYDGNTSASGVTITLEGIVGSDIVSVDMVAAEYTDAATGTKTINITDVTLTGADAANYTVTLPANNILVAGITKTAGAAVSVPLITGDATTLTISITDPAVLQAATGQDIEYAIYDGSALSPYGSGITFTWLSTGKVYSVYARSAEDATYSAGAPSVSDTIAFYSVAFNANGGSGEPAAYNVLDGGKIVEPAADPTRTGYTFGGWYKEAACINEWVFDSDTVGVDTTLYAKWLAGQNFEIEVADITEPDFGLNIASGIVLSRSGIGVYSKTAGISVNIPAGWTVEWRYNGEILGSNAALTLNVSDNPSDAGYIAPYNIVGARHLLTVVLVTTEGALYSRIIEFEVRQ